MFYDVLNLFIFVFVAAFIQNDRYEENKSHKSPCNYCLDLCQPGHLNWIFRFTS